MMGTGIEAFELIQRHGIDKTFWGGRIIHASESDTREFTEEDVELAQEWATCACGRQDERIPRIWDGGPEDVELRFLGRLFMDAVEESEIAVAALVLVNIERRAREILAELGKQL